MAEGTVTTAERKLCPVCSTPLSQTPGQWCPRCFTIRVNWRPRGFLCPVCKRRHT